MWEPLAHRKPSLGDQGIRHWACRGAETPQALAHRTGLSPGEGSAAGTHWCLLSAANFAQREEVLQRPGQAGPEGGGDIGQGAENPSEMALRTLSSKHPLIPCSWRSCGTLPAGSWFQCQASDTEEVLRLLFQALSCSRLRAHLSTGAFFLPRTPSSSTKESPKYSLHSLYVNPWSWHRGRGSPLVLALESDFVDLHHVSAGWEREGVCLAQRPLQMPPF